ncbi:Pentatricopeptide repeat-containing protein [Striga hermonthica]|uniref:Pentatricopeptide repeat-containing protein n=1 Tax=Striga hermonthica TaxID=68872 RepID=A0A9N7RQQ5_STRHE|nr:Pentatricopeptide repeat-containing protein [Striga hermonthica]
MMADKSSSTVYIGNLDERVGDRVLYDILIQAGRVVDLHIPRDRETDKPKGFAFAEYESEEVAAYAVKLFTGLVTLYKRTLKFAISGQDKSSASLPVANTPMVTSSLKPRPYHAPYDNTELSSQSLSRFSENKINYIQAPVPYDVSMNQPNGYRTHHDSVDYNYSRRVFGAVLDSMMRRREPTWDADEIETMSVILSPSAVVYTPPPADLFTINNYINSLAKSGQLHLANKVFGKMPQKNAVSWTVLISGYAQHGKSDQCFHLFGQMMFHFRPNDFAYASVLSVCDCPRGRQVHGLVLKTGFGSWIYVANSLLAMYWKNSRDSGSEAWRVFESMDFRNLVTYNSMISGFGMHGEGDRAMDLFIRMHHDGVEFDRATILALAGLVLDVSKTALIKGYSALASEFSGCLKLFMETSGNDRDIVLWTGILTACAEWEPHAEGLCCYAMHGKAENALIAFEKWTLVPMGPFPQLDHYACMVDILGRAGHVSEVERIVREMPMRPDYVIRSAFLGACHKYGDARAASLALSNLKELDPENSLGYVLTSNIYCLFRNYDVGGSLRMKMNHIGVRKEPGLSWTEVGHRVHEFSCGGHRHHMLIHQL